MDGDMQYIFQCTSPAGNNTLNRPKFLSWFGGHKSPLMECDLERWKYGSKSILYIVFELAPVIFRSGRKLKIKLERYPGHHAANFVQRQ